MQKTHLKRADESGRSSSVPQGAIRPRGTLFKALTQEPKTSPCKASAVRSSGFHYSRAHLRPVNKQSSPGVKSNRKCIPPSERAGKSQLLTVEILQQHMQNNTLKEVIDAAVGAHSDSDREAHSKLTSEFT